MTELRVYCSDGVYTFNASISNQYKSIIVDESCSKLDSNSLHLSFLEHVTLPNTLTEIGDDCFKESQIVELNIPKSVTNLNQNNQFNFMSKLERIIVEEGNPNYASNNGILFSSNFDQLLHYPGHIVSPIYVVPQSVRYIGSYAFYAHEYIETLVFHDKILEFRSGAFQFSTKLKNIRIPSECPLPNNIGDPFYQSSFKFPYNVTFYVDIIPTCRMIKDCSSIRFYISFIFFAMG